MQTMHKQISHGSLVCTSDILENGRSIQHELAFAQKYRQSSQNVQQNEIVKPKCYQNI